jgi:hypothetical protein
MRRGKSRMQSRKNLLKSMVRDYAKSRAQLKKAYDRKGYDGHDDTEED